MQFSLFQYTNQLTDQDNPVLFKTTGPLPDYRRNKILYNNILMSLDKIVTPAMVKLVFQAKRSANCEAQLLVAIFHSSQCSV